MSDYQGQTETDFEEEQLGDEKRGRSNSHSGFPLPVLSEPERQGQREEDGRHGGQGDVLETLGELGTGCVPCQVEVPEGVGTKRRVAD